MTEDTITTIMAGLFVIAIFVMIYGPMACYCVINKTVPSWLALGVATCGFVLIMLYWVANSDQYAYHVFRNLPYCLRSHVDQTLHPGNYTRVYWCNPVTGKYEEAELVHPGYALTPNDVAPSWEDIFIYAKE